MGQDAPAIGVGWYAVSGPVDGEIGFHLPDDECGVSG
ncbi:hypothetical protein QFZ33_002436 [Arthrobacter globiformis]|nr:hypothetical protein [Arthrobacter globiformis]